MENNIINTEEIVETAEDIIVAGESKDWLKRLGGIGIVAGAVVVAGFAIAKGIKYFKAKKAAAENSNYDLSEVDSIEYDEE